VTMLRNKSGVPERAYGDWSYIVGPKATAVALNGALRLKRTVVLCVDRNTRYGLRWRRCCETDRSQSCMEQTHAPPRLVPQSTRGVKDRPRGRNGVGRQ
jgi:hypothetical protein